MSVSWQDGASTSGYVSNDGAGLCVEENAHVLRCTLVTLTSSPLFGSQLDCRVSCLEKAANTQAVLACGVL